MRVLSKLSCHQYLIGYGMLCRLIDVKQMLLRNQILFKKISHQEQGEHKEESNLTTGLPRAS